MAEFIVTAARISPAKSNLSAPKVIYLDSAQVVKIKLFKGGTSLLYGTSSRPYKKYRLYETPSQVAVAQNISQGFALSTNPYMADYNLALSLTGNTQGAATALPNYLNVVAANGAAAASNSAKLPSASVYADGVAYSASFNKGARVLINGGSVALSIFPQVGESINGLAANTAVTLAIGGRLAFAPSASNAWKTALETVE